MPDNSIAKGSVTIGVDSGGVDAGVAKIQSKLAGLQKYVNEQFKLRSPSFLQTSGAFAIGNLAASAARSGFSTITSSLGNIRREIATAKGLGFSQDFFAGIGVQARQLGLDLEDTSRGFTHFQQLQAAAISGDTHAENVFERLGVSLQQLSSGNPEDTWKRIADSVNAMSNPLDKANARIELFGVKQQQLGKVFSGGSEGLQAARQTARQLGLAMTQGNADAVENAVRSWVAASSRVDAAWSATLRGWSAQAAPLLEALATALEGGTTHAGQAAPSWVQAIPHAATLVGTTIVEAFLEGCARLGQWTAEFLAGLGELIKRLPRVLGGGENGVGASLSAFGTQNAKELAAVAQDRASRTWTEALRKFLDVSSLANTNAPRPPRTESQLLVQRATEFADSLRRGNAEFGLTAEQMERERLARAGLRGALLTEIDTLIEHRQARELDRQQEEEYGKKRADAQQLIQSIETPSERFNREKTRLDSLLQHEMLTEDQHATALAQAFRQFGSGLGENRLPDSILKGSAEEVRTIAQTFAEGREGPQEQVARTVQQSLEIDRQQLAVNREIRDAVRQLYAGARPAGQAAAAAASGTRSAAVGPAGFAGSGVGNAQTNALLQRIVDAITAQNQNNNNVNIDVEGV